MAYTRVHAGIAACLLLFYFLIAGCSLDKDWYQNKDMIDPGSPFSTLSDSAYVVSTNTNDVPDYLCDGTQDQIEINLAIVAASKDPNKRTVQLKAGTYYVDSSILVNNNVILKGEGMSNTVIYLIDNAPTFINNAGIVRIRVKSGRITNARIEDFTIDGNESHQEATDQKKYGIYAEGDNITMRRIVARNCAGYGFDPHSAKSHTVAASNLVIENCISEYNRTDGFALDMVQHSIISNNIARNNGRHGFNLCTTAAYDLLIDNMAFSNTANGIMVQNGSHTVDFIRNRISANQEIGILLRSSHDCTIDSNVISDNGKFAVDVRGVEKVVISANNMSNNGFTDPVRYSQIFFEDYSLVPSVSNFVIFNRISTTKSPEQAAVQEELGSDYNWICSNTVSGFMRPYIITGTNTICFTGGSVSRTNSTGNLLYISVISNSKLTRSPTDLVVSPDSLHVYVALSASDGIAWFSVDKDTKELTYCGRLSDAALFNEAMSLEITPDGSNVYLSSRLSASISWFNRDFHTGNLTYMGQYSNQSIIPNCSAVCLSPDGSNAYVCTSFPYSNIAVFNRDPGNGALVFVTNYGDVCYQGGQTIKCTADGSFVMVACSSADALCVFSRNPTNGLLTYSTRYKESNHRYKFRNFCFSPDDRFIYTANPSNNSITLLQNDSGTLTFVDLVASSEDLANVYNVYATAEHLYACGRNTQKIVVYDRNSVTGILTKQSEWKDETKVLGPRCFQVSADGSFGIVDGIGNHSVASFKLKE